VYHPDDMTSGTLPALFQRDSPLAAQCRFHIGGPADYFIAVDTPQALARACHLARAYEQPCFVYSGGSNLFFDSAGFRGVVIRIHGGGWTLSEMTLPSTLGGYVGRDSLWSGPHSSEVNTTSISGRAAEQEAGARRDEAPDTRPSDTAPAPTPCVKAAAGCDLSLLVRELAQRDLGGIEWLGNIPGSLGGAVAGNAGCYGRAIAEVLVEAEVLEPGQDEPRSVGPDYFAFAYRHSAVKDRPGVYVVSATLRLGQREGEEVLREVEDELAERRRKHPHDALCAGSFFKNPSREQPAWKLIAEAGLADARVGEAMLHPKHPNFLVNAGGASSDDVLALARLVRAGVRDSFGIELEAEVRYVGERGIEAI
jgi:UDP-N-acetylmuramate dehydrogenase